ncbi:FIG001196: Membrane protein YedZ [hydrothermal vent metagenome]|uniref:FIG001196: Membrane protein YedZ n=1 Tax=hydrothermal vent metagenome TaxID=652676 RepID=A0A1W1BW77_9ZZZZ
MKLFLFILLSLPFDFLVWDIINENFIDPIEEITNPTGEWALRFLLLTLAISPLNKITKISLIKYRRMFGLMSFFYAVLHLGIFLIDKEFSLTLVFADIFKRPYITIGFSAFILMFLLTITSNSFSIKKLKNKWKKLHNLIYLISLLVIVHFYWQVKSWQDIEPLIYTSITLFLLGIRYVKR